MKSALWVSTLLLLVAVVTVADSTIVNGRWTVRYVSGVAWKTIGAAEFEFKADGDRITGMQALGKDIPERLRFQTGRLTAATSRSPFTVNSRPAADFPKWTSSGRSRATKSS
jgi:hypothetical protein